MMVGLVGYAPTTPAMSMQYSTIELQSQNLSNYFDKNMFVFFPTEYIMDKLIQKRVKL